MILAAAAAAMAASLCAEDPTWRDKPFAATSCPQVYSIHGNVPTDHALDIVFLPAGFTESELDVFRCGVALTLQSMLSRPPFDSWACSINAWRIDLATPHSFSPPASCGTASCIRTPPVWSDADRTAQCAALAPPPRGTPMGDPSAPACLTLALDAEGCPPGATSCRVIWPTAAGLQRAWRLAACAPAFDIVVIVVNAGDWAGGGAADMNPPLTVVTLNGVSADRTRGRLLAHELGHALGLLDEYQDGYPDASGAPVFHANRNIAKLGVSPPWKDLCGAAGCAQVLRCPTVKQPAELPGVGLWQGAFYSTCDYFRASQDCSMQDPDEEFCPACVAYTSKLFEDMGMKRCGP